MNKICNITSLCRIKYSDRISYVMTLSEPELLENLHLSPDYDHDINKQIQPIADAILPFYRMILQFRSPDR
ncbi:hypothetical protein [Photorhabdus antumapuensis]|uniref:hypothetical protein n=1 Tax=Photorhabdus antumapuensis TaxID=2862867 RepID=UPI001CEC5EE4|nr:hypothetical protein [Photorhabdus antumapuensis]